jgi:hypothetical protein
MPAMKIPGGSSAPKKAPTPAVKAQASETKQQAAVEKKYTAPAKNKGEGSKAASDKAKADALKEVQKIPVRDAHDKPTVKPTPPPPPPVVTKVKKSGTGTDTGTGTGSGDQKDDTTGGSNPAMPPTPTPVVVETPKAAEPKTPTRDVTNISSLVPQFNAEHITKILFENLSAVELSIVERHDTIEGINQRYSIISNLSEIRKKYDIAKQLTVMDKFKPLTRIFTINVEDKIPQEDYIALEDLTATYQYLDENNQIVTREKGYYYIDTNGDLVIELINMERNQQVEVEIDTNGTIYKVES